MYIHKAMVTIGYYIYIYIYIYIVPDVNIALLKSKMNRKVSA